MTFRLARVANVKVDDLLSGRYPEAGVCPRCAAPSSSQSTGCSSLEGPRSLRYDVFIMSRLAQRVRRALLENQALELQGADLVYETRGVVFSWKATKAMKVARERGISLVEVASVFLNPSSIPEPDTRYPDRGTYIGESDRERVLFFVHAELVDDHELRIITARLATPEEGREYARKLLDLQTGARDPDRRGRKRSSFIEFFMRHRSPRSVLRQVPAGIRSRSTGVAARMQERGWAIGRALGLATVGERVRGVRLVIGITQMQLADLSRIAQASLSRIERNEEHLGVRRAEALARVFRVQPAELLWGLPIPRRSR